MVETTVSRNHEGEEDEQIRYENTQFIVCIYILAAVEQKGTKFIEKQR